MFYVFKGTYHLNIMPGAGCPFPAGHYCVVHSQSELAPLGTTQDPFPCWSAFRLWPACLPRLGWTLWHHYWPRCPLGLLAMGRAAMSTHTRNPHKSWLQKKCWASCYAFLFFEDSRKLSGPTLELCLWRLENCFAFRQYVPMQPRLAWKLRWLWTGGPATSA